MTRRLYERDGSRFVLYSAQAQNVPPIPVPQPVRPADAGGWLERTTDDGAPYRVRQWESVDTSAVASCCPDCVYGERF